jgi:exo-poly-alpha-galacturonosidase
MYKTFRVQTLTCALLLCVSSLQAQTSTHPAPTNLQIPEQSVDDHSAQIVWQAPADIRHIRDYQIFQNQQLLGTSSTNNIAHSPAAPYIQAFYQDGIRQHTQQLQQPIVYQSFLTTQLKPQTTYQFTVKAVYEDGSVSESSIPVQLTTRDTPAQHLVITDFGAKADDATLNTAAIQQAIDTCKPGCVLTVPSGIFKTGALWLKSDMTLDLAKGAVLLGSERPEDYPPAYYLYPYSKHQRPASLINVLPRDKTAVTNFHNIRIVGSGTIDGNGWLHDDASATQPDALGHTPPHYRKSDNGKVQDDGILAKNQVAAAQANGIDLKSAYGEYRSSLLTIADTRNIYIHGITLRNPAYHGLMLLHDQQATVSNVTFQTFDANNGDGIEFGNSQHVMAFNNLMDTGDDCINFAAGTGKLAAKQPPMQDAWLFNNYFQHGHGAIVTGSHTGAWIEQILAENNVMNGTDIGLRAKSTTYIGGGARQITFRNNAMKDLTKSAVVITLAYSDSNANLDYPKATEPAAFYDFTILNNSVQGISGKGPSIDIQGNTAQGAWHHQLNVSHLILDDVPGARVSDVRDSQFNQIDFHHLRDKNPWQFKDVVAVTLDGKAVTTTK